MQTRLQSAIESIVNILIGMGVALGSQYIIFPLVGIHNVAHSTHLWITFWFTLVSFVRSYCIRRWFSHRLNAVIARWTTALQERFG